MRLAALLSASLALVAFLFASAGSPVVAKSAAHKHILSDDGAADRSFDSFRARLMQAIREKDRDFVVSIIADDIAWTIDRKTDKKQFLKEWQDLSPASRFWPRIEKALSHGAQSDGDGFSAPAIAFADSHSERPQAIVFNDGAALRRAAKLQAAVIGPVFDQQVTLLEPPGREPLSTNWAKVVTANGATGYVLCKDIFSAFDDFAVFKKSGDSWQLQWFGFAAGL